MTAKSKRKFGIRPYDTICGPPYNNNCYPPNSRMPVSLSASNDFGYNVGIYGNPNCTPPPLASASMAEPSPGSFSASLPLGGPGTYYIQWENRTTLSVVSTVTITVSPNCPQTRDCKHFEAEELCPAALTLQFTGGPIKPGTNGDCDELNHPPQLTHAQLDQCFWISPPLDCGDEVNPAYWILTKTGKDSWLLRLRRITEELAAYSTPANAKPKKNGSFQVILNRGLVSKQFTNWPSKITVVEAK